MTTLKEKRSIWMCAIRDYSDALKLSHDTGKPISNLLDLLAKLKSARRDYFNEYLAVSRQENEDYQKRHIIATTPDHVDSGQRAPY